MLPTLFLSPLGRQTSQVRRLTPPSTPPPTPPSPLMCTDFAISSKKNAHSTYCSIDTSKLQVWCKYLSKNCVLPASPILQCNIDCRYPPHPHPHPPPLPPPLPLPLPLHLSPAKETVPCICKNCNRINQ